MRRDLFGLPEKEKQQLDRELFIEALEIESPELPDDETLIRFADGTLQGEEREAIQRLARQGHVAITIISQFVCDYAPIRRLSEGWDGWKGPVLYVFERLPKNVSKEDWQAHMARNDRSRKRTEALLRLKREE